MVQPRLRLVRRLVERGPESAFLQLNSPLGEGDDGNFGRAAEAKGEVDRTDASIDIELHPVGKLEKSMHVFGAHSGEKERRQERNTNLAPVGMSGERQVDLAPQR